MTKLPIYLDYAATTPVDKRVIEKMISYLSWEGFFGNPASAHAFGTSALEAVEQAREKIACVLHATPRQIIFTSGATEANNLALKGISAFYKQKGNHIITSKTEHPSILDTCAYLETLGYSITYLDPDKNGRINLQELENTIRPETVLVSIMHVNNETGVIQDIQAIGDITRKLGVFFHVDAAQSFGKLPLNLQQMKIDLVSLSAHKVYGPKGIGALYIANTPRVRLTPLLHGGSQERKFRAGTLPTHQIIGMAEAFEIAEREREKSMHSIQRLRDLFWEGLSDLPEVYLNHNLSVSLPNIINIRFKGVEKESLLPLFEQIAVSNASACNSITLQPSHVLRAMGLSDEDANRSFRFSFGKWTTECEITETIKIVRDHYLSARKQLCH